MARGFYLAHCTKKNYLIILNFASKNESWVLPNPDTSFYKIVFRFHALAQGVTEFAFLILSSSDIVHILVLLLFLAKQVNIVY
jgi:hypothetical protein